MCSIPQAVVAGIQIASTLVQASAQKNTANYQTQAIAQNYALQTAQTYQEYQQRQQQTMEQMSQRAKESWVEEGRLQAAMGESGFQAGGTDQRILNEAQTNAAYDISTLENNRLKAQEQTHVQGLSNQAQAQSQYNSVKQPSSLGVGLQIAGAAAGAWELGSKPTPENSPIPTK